MSTPKIVKVTPVGQGDRDSSNDRALTMYNRVMRRAEAQYRYRVLAGLVDDETASSSETARIMVGFQDAMIYFLGGRVGGSALPLFLYTVRDMDREVFQAAIELYKLFERERDLCLSR